MLLLNDIIDLWLLCKMSYGKCLLWCIKNPFLISWCTLLYVKPALFEIVALVSSPSNSIAASAVCAFNLSAITQVFNGPFRYQENPRTSWLSTPNPIPNFQVGNTPTPAICYYSLIDEENQYTKCCNLQVKYVSMSANPQASPHVWRIWI